MAGLLRRSKRSDRSRSPGPNQKPVPANAAVQAPKAVPVRPLPAVPVQTGLPDDLKGEKAVGISFDEQIEIIGQINDVLRKNRIQVRTDTFSFVPQKKGTVIPILVNVTALAVTLIAAVLILNFYDRGERNLVTQSMAVLSTEGRILEAFKKESAEQLGAKDRQISEIQTRLEQLARERDRLKLETQAQIRAREAELKAALDRQLAEQRQKLEREGIQSGAIERELRSLESRLAESNERRLQDFRKQTEEQLAAKDASLAAMARQYTESLRAFQQERTTLEERLKNREAELQAQLRERTAAAESERTAVAGELARLQGERQKEQLLFDQLLSGYEKVRSDWGKALYDEALKDLDAVQELLSRESVLSLPAIRSRLPLERFTIDSLRRLITAERVGSRPAQAAAPSEADALLAAVSQTVAEAERKARAGSGAEALKLYEAALMKIPEVKKSYAALTSAARSETAGERQRLQAELHKAREGLNRLTQETARYQAEAKRRAGLEAQLRALREHIAEAGKGGSASTQAQVLALLETKLRVRQVLSSEPVKSQHPGLYEQLEQYLDAFGREQQQEGQSTVLSDAMTLLDSLKGGRADPRRFKGDYSGALGDLFNRFLEKLQDLLR
jgi:chromosome segregation ATPase